MNAFFPLYPIEIRQRDLPWSSPSSSDYFACYAGGTFLCCFFHNATSIWQVGGTSVDPKMHHTMQQCFTQSNIQEPNLMLATFKWVIFFLIVPLHVSGGSYYTFMSLKWVFWTYFVARKFWYLVAYSVHKSWESDSSFNLHVCY